MAPDWATIASLATAGGTLVLAVATFASVRSAHHAARVAEQALLVGLRPLLIPSRLQDERQKVFFGDGKYSLVPGGGGTVEVEGDVIYLAMSVRNAGNGIAVLRAWRAAPGQDRSTQHPDVSEFQRHGRDIFVAPAELGFWQAALRDPEDPRREPMLEAIKASQPLTVDVLYGDHEGGQRAVSRFQLRPVGDEGRWLVSVVHHWNLDRPDPR
jgi:hypothetical protein